MVLLLILAVFGLSSAWGVASRARGSDFYQFWVLGQALGRPAVANIYSDDGRLGVGAEYLERARREGSPRQIAVAERRQTLETYSSPFLYSVFRMFSTGDYEADFRNYGLLMLGCLTFGIIILSRLLDHSWGTTFGAIAICSAWFGPFSSDLRVGNVNSIQLAALAAYLWMVIRMRWRYRDILGGALIGLAVAFKPNLVFVAGVLAVNWILNGRIRRLWHHATGAAVGGIVAIGIAAASFGSLRCWTDWISAIGSLPDKIITVELGNFAPAKLFGEWLGVDATIPLAVVFGGLVVAGMWLRRRDIPRESGPMPATDPFPEVLVVSTGCLLVVLIPRLAWLHYYVLTIPAFLVLLCPAAVRRPAAGSTLLRQILVTLALLCLAFGPIVNSGISLPVHIQCVLTVFAAMTLFILTVFLRGTPNKQIPSASTPS